MGEIGESFSVKGFNRAPRIECAFKDLKLRLSEYVCAILQFHIETHVRLIHAKAVHRFVVAHTKEGGFDVLAQRVLPNTFHETLDQGIHIFAVDKREFDVELRKLWLAIGTQVFVSKATG